MDAASARSFGVRVWCHHLGDFLSEPPGPRSRYSHGTALTLLECVLLIPTGSEIAFCSGSSQSASRNRILDTLRAERVLGEIETV